MKNTLKAFATVAIALLTIMSNANAQTTISKSTNFVSTSTSIIDDGEKNNDASSTISTRALKDFQKTFNGINNAVWSKTYDKGYAARFTSDGVQTLAAYNHRGVWQHTIRYYDEKKLPRDVRGIVKSTYYDYAISMIAEVYFNNQMVYVIYIQDETHFKILRVYDGETDEMGSYIKG